MAWNRKWPSSPKATNVCVVFPPLFLFSPKRLRKALQLFASDIVWAIAKCIDFINYPPELLYIHDIIGDINLIDSNEKCKCFFGRHPKSITFSILL